MHTSTYITLQGDLCNEPTFLLSKFNEWISVTRARLKAGPSHPLDILITIATVAVGAFFCLVIASQLPVPWAKIFGRKEEEEEENEDGVRIEVPVIHSGKKKRKKRAVKEAGKKEKREEEKEEDEGADAEGNQ